MTLRAALLLLVALAFAASPLFSSFDGFDPARYPVPQPDPPPIQPAGWAFAIWGPIYALLLAHAAFGLLRRAEDPEWDAPRPALIASLAVGVPWLWVAERAPLAATLLILVMLASALMAHARTRAGRDGLLLAPPVALYAGWLTAASAVALGVSAGGYGVLAPGAAAWAGLALALLVAGSVQARIARGPVYALGAIWALVGVAAQNAGERLELTLAAAAGALLLAALAWRGARGAAGVALRAR